MTTAAVGSRKSPMAMHLCVGDRPFPAADELSLVASFPGFRLSGTPATIDRQLGDGRRLLIWGDVFYVTGGSQQVASGAHGHDIGAAAAGAVSALPLADALARIEGIYAGALVEPDGSVTVFGDPLGRSDIFYAPTGDGVVASLSLPDALGAAQVRGFSAASLSTFLTVFGYYAPKRHTIYAGVRRLGLGETLMATGARWRVERRPFTPQPIAEYGPRELDEYADLFLAAVDARATDDNWVFLSSGWDSTAILAALVKLRGARRVRAVIGRMDYSNRVDGINKFEIERAQQVAKYFDIPLDIVSLNMREPEAIEIWDEVRHTFRDRINYALAGYNQVRMARHIAAQGGSPVVFTGEHSDGLHNFGFSQYATLFHRDLRFREYADKMGCYLFGPTFFRSVEAGTHTTDEVYRFFGMLAPNAAVSADTIDPRLRRMQFLLPFFLGPRRVPFADTAHPMLTKDGALMREQFVVSEYLGDCVNSVTPETLYSWFHHLYGSFHWQSSTATMATVGLEMHGLPIRMPFGDARLVDFCSRMPEHWGRGLDLNPTKYPLKWTLQSRIDYPMHLQIGPHSYLYDVDPSFSHSAEILYGSAVVPRFQEVLRTRRYRDLLDERYFDMTYIDGLVDDFLNGIERRGQPLSDLFALASLALIGWNDAE